MLTVQPLVSVQYASVEMGTLGILSLSVDLSPAPPVLVALMLTVPPLEGLQYVSASPVTPGTPTPTAGLTPAPATLVARVPYVRITAELLSASVPLNTLETPT